MFPIYVQLWSIMMMMIIIIMWLRLMFSICSLMINMIDNDDDHHQIIRLMFSISGHIPRESDCFNLSTTQNNANIARGTTDPGYWVHNSHNPDSRVKTKSNYLPFIWYQYIHGKRKRSWSSLCQKSSSPPSDNTSERCFCVGALAISSLYSSGFTSSPIHLLYLDCITTHHPGVNIGW